MTLLKVLISSYEIIISFIFTIFVNVTGITFTTLTLCILLHGVILCVSKCRSYHQHECLQVQGLTVLLNISKLTIEF